MSGNEQPRRWLLRLRSSSYSTVWDVGTCRAGLKRTWWEGKEEKGRRKREAPH